MSKLVWYFQTTGVLDVVAPLVRPLLVGLALYYSSYLVILTQVLWRWCRLQPGPKPSRPAVMKPAVIVLPTLMRSTAELDGIKRAVRSILTNGYPGPLFVCPSIDGARDSAGLCHELDAWVAQLELPNDAKVWPVYNRERGGKAMAIDGAVYEIQKRKDRGELARLPEVFFNMDADSELAPQTLERMAYRLTTPGRFSKERPFIVASNVCVARKHYWRGWRKLFTVRGQLAVQVAREYVTSISLARHNNRLIPVTAVSGALYCTWLRLHLQAPRYANFVRNLTFWDWLRWWMGAQPPSFAHSNVRPLPEATTGPGDDTWYAWLALAARWKNGRIDLELPPTPLHALGWMLRSYFFRPIAYDSAAKVYTSTPTTVRGLFKQRVRWNSSRIWLINRFGVSLLYKWSVGLPVVVDATLLIALHSVIVVALFVWPIANQPTQWFALLLIVNLAYAGIRGFGTTLSMLHEGVFLQEWRKLLALPLSGPYHLMFNVFTTVVGFGSDLLGFGVNTGFAPESTLIRSGTGRVALAYRLRRAVGLAARSVMQGDVPLGTFWFGWEATPWTRNGYEGWTTKRRRAK